jgi:uncharacterized protein involved in exopolysaccharide biosynthesis
MNGRELVLFENQPPDRPPGPREWAAVGFRWRTRMAVVFAITLLVAGVAAFTGWEYESEMKILVQRERIDPVVTVGQTRAEVRADLNEEELNAEIELIRSDDVIRNVVLGLGLQKKTREPMWFRLWRPENSGSEEIRTAKAVRALDKAMDVSLPKKSGVITVRYRSGDPKLAAAVLTAVSRFYLEKHTQVRRPPGQFEFFEQQTELYRRQLAEAESRLASFARSGGTMSGQMELDNALKKLADLRLVYHQTTTAIDETDKRIATLQAQMDSTPARMTTAVRTADNPHLIMQLKTTLLNLELKRTELLKKFNPTYREVQEVDLQIAETRAAIAAAENSPPRDVTTDRDPTYEWLKAELAKARTEMAGLKARASSLQRTISESWAEAQKLNENSLRQQDLAREAKALEESYRLYMSKREEARISDDLDRKRILNVSIVQAPTFPVLPRRSPWVVALGGIVAAFVLSAGTALVSEYLDDSLRTPQAVEGSLNLPVLAVFVPETRLLERGSTDATGHE